MDDQIVVVYWQVIPRKAFGSHRSRSDLKEDNWCRHVMLLSVSFFSSPSEFKSNEENSADLLPTADIRSILKIPMMLNTSLVCILREGKF